MKQKYGFCLKCGANLRHPVNAYHHRNGCNKDTEVQQEKEGAIKEGAGVKLAPRRSKC